MKNLSAILRGTNYGTLPVANGGTGLTASAALDDISNSCDSATSVFNLTVNQVALNTIIDSKDLDVFVNGLKLSPYITRLTYPWLTPYDSFSGYRVNNLPNDAGATVGKLIIYKAPAIGSTVSLIQRSSSATKQTQQYPFNATTIALGD